MKNKSAKEFLDKEGVLIEDAQATKNIIGAMVEFADYHVREALESAVNNVSLDEKEDYSPDYEKGTLYRKYFEVNEESIYAAYPKENIKGE